MILAYTKQNFNDGEVLYASQLNKMDNQIEANTNAINSNTETINSHTNAINALENLRVNDKPDAINTHISDGGRKAIRAMVSFIDDDCRKEVYENVVDGIDRSLLSVIGEKDAEGNISKINIPYMLACPPGDILDEDTNTGKSGYMTKQQLLNMYNAGVELTCHHFHQYNMDDTEHFQDIYAYENDLKSCQEKFLSWGINDVNTVSYPQGRYVDEFINTVKKYYKMGFTVTPGINTIPYESYYMKRVGLFKNAQDDTNGTAAAETLEEAKGYVDQVKADGGWLIFMTHAWYAGFSKDALNLLIQYIIDEGVEIVGVHEALEATGNVIETGVFKKPLEDATTPYFVVDSDGKVWSYQSGQVDIPEYEKNVELTLIPNKRINFNGIVTDPTKTDASYVVTDYIDVSDCVALIISGFASDNNCLYAFYDESGVVIKKSQVTSAYGETNGVYHLDVNIPKTAKSVVVAGYGYKQMPLIRKVYAYDHLKTYDRKNEKAAINELYDKINGFKSEIVRSTVTTGMKIGASGKTTNTSTSEDPNSFIVSQEMAVDPQYEYYILSGSARWGNAVYAVLDEAGVVIPECSYITTSSDNGRVIKQQKVVMPENAKTFRVASYLDVQPEGFQIIGVKPPENPQYARKGWTTEQINLLEQLFSYVTWNNDSGSAIAEQLITSLKG